MVEWVRLYVGMFNNLKIKQIDSMENRDVIHYIWVSTILLAGRCNCDGELYLTEDIPYTIKTLAIEFRRSVDQVKEAFKVFQKYKMIGVTEDKVFYICGWQKHQNVDGLEKIRKQTNERVMKYRARKREEKRLAEEQKKAEEALEEEQKKGEEGINNNEKSCCKDNSPASDNVQKDNVDEENVNTGIADNKDFESAHEIKKDKIKNCQNEQDDIDHGKVKNNQIKQAGINNGHNKNSDVEQNAIENGDSKNSEVEQDAIENGDNKNSEVKQDAIENGDSKNCEAEQNAIENGDRKNSEVEQNAIKHGESKNNVTRHGNIECNNTEIDSNVTCNVDNNVTPEQNIHPVTHKNKKQNKIKKLREEKDNKDNYDYSSNNKSHSSKEGESVSEPENIYSKAIELAAYCEKLTGRIGLLDISGLNMAVEIHGSKNVKKAIEKAIENGTIKLNYIMGILRNWAKEGYPEDECDYGISGSKNKYGKCDYGSNRSKKKYGECDSGENGINKKYGEFDSDENGIKKKYGECDSGENGINKKYGEWDSGIRGSKKKYGGGNGYGAECSSKGCGPDKNEFKGIRPGKARKLSEEERRKASANVV